MGVLMRGGSWADARAATARSATAFEKDFILALEITKKNQEI